MFQQLLDVTHTNRQNLLECLNIKATEEPDLQSLGRDLYTVILTTVNNFKGILYQYNKNKLLHPFLPYVQHYRIKIFGLSITAYSTSVAVVLLLTQSSCLSFNLTKQK